MVMRRHDPNRLADEATDADQVRFLSRLIGLKARVTRVNSESGFTSVALEPSQIVIRVPDSSRSDEVILLDALVRSLTASSNAAGDPDISRRYQDIIRKAWEPHIDRIANAVVCDEVLSL